MCARPWCDIVPSPDTDCAAADRSALRAIWSARVGGDYMAPACISHKAGRHVLLSLSDTRLSKVCLKNVASGWDVGRLTIHAPFLLSGVHAAFRRALERAGAEVVSVVCNPHQLVDQHDIVLVDEMNDVGLLGLAADRSVWNVGSRAPVRESPATAAALVNRWTRYTDPFSGEEIDLHHVIALLSEWRERINENRQISACIGMAWWKRARMVDFFTHAPGKPVFSRSVARAVTVAQTRQGAIACWSTRRPHALTRRVARAGVPVWCVEDGFIRSLGLGSDLLPPASIVVDRHGIYFDPGSPSDLERLLASYQFDDAIRARARHLVDRIIREKISKYGSIPTAPAMRQTIKPAPPGRHVILVPGQVADDQSVKKGGAGIKGNYDLLARVRGANPDAWIIYRPHPDVDAGHRKGAIDDTAVLRLADCICREGSMASLLEQVDEVHTLTSLTGFEALMRNIKVSVWGQPFYAGWGLTTDYAPHLPRRGRSLTLEELIAATLILYPRYLDPLTGLPCGPEVLIDRFSTAALWKPTMRTRIRRLQGALWRYATKQTNRIAQALTDD